jgi:hypothetical protein
MSASKLLRVSSSKQLPKVTIAKESKLKPVIRTVWLEASKRMQPEINFGDLWQSWQSWQSGKQKAELWL